MLCLTGQEALWDKKREICILRTCLLEHTIQLALHLLPYSIAIRLNHHTSAHSRLFGQVCLYYEVIIPLTVIVSTFCQFF